MKRKFTFIYPLFSLILLASLFISYAGGRDDEYAGAPNDFGACDGCHGGGDPTGNVTLSNVPNRFIAGQTYALTLTIQHAAALRGGFQIVATNGTTNAMVGSFTASTGMRLNNVSRLTQSTPRNFSSGSVSWTFNWTAPSSNTPRVVFYYAGNAVNGDGGTSGDAVFTGNSSTTIPIELVNFEAKKGADKTINLAWTTASEQNNRIFDVERSVNNQKFETIATLKGSGTSAATHNYQFTDDADKMGSNVVYYRLRQIDFDGNSTYSKTISVALLSKTSLKIYPTLAKQGDVLNLETTENGRIDLIDMSGKIVKTIQQPLQVGNQSVTTVNVVTADLPTGRYFVRSLGNGLLQTAGFVVF
jgi:hypothetical protein